MNVISNNCNLYLVVCFSSEMFMPFKVTLMESLGPWQQNISVNQNKTVRNTMQPTCQCFLLKYCVATRAIVGLKCTEGHQLMLAGTEVSWYTGNAGWALCTIEQLVALVEKKKLEQLAVFYILRLQYCAKILTHPIFNIYGRRTRNMQYL